MPNATATRPQALRTALHLVVLPVHLVRLWWMYWCLTSTRQYIEECAADGILVGRTLDAWREQEVELTCRYLILRQEIFK